MKNIQKYLSFQSRNKLVIQKHNLDIVETINVGSLVAEAISNFLDDKKLSLKVTNIIEEIFEVSKVKHQDLGRILAIKNLGILFEPELKIDFLSLIDKYSSTNALFIQWDGEIENNTLYFLSKQKGQKINIKNLSHIAV
jgi:hypothetical protein